MQWSSKIIQRVTITDKSCRIPYGQCGLAEGVICMDPASYLTEEQSFYDGNSTLIRRLAHHRHQDRDSLDKITKSDIFVGTVLVVVDIHRGHLGGRDPQRFDEG